MNKIVYKASNGIKYFIEIENLFTSDEAEELIQLDECNKSFTSVIGFQVYDEENNNITLRLDKNILAEIIDQVQRNRVE